MAVSERLGAITADLVAQLSGELPEEKIKELIALSVAVINYQRKFQQAQIQFPVQSTTPSSVSSLFPVSSLDILPLKDAYKKYNSRAWLISEEHENEDLYFESIIRSMVPFLIKNKGRIINFEYISAYVKAEDTDTDPLYKELIQLLQVRIDGYSFNDAPIEDFETVKLRQISEELRIACYQDSTNIYSKSLQEIYALKKASVKQVGDDLIDSDLIPASESSAKYIDLTTKWLLDVDIFSCLEAAYGQQMHEGLMHLSSSAGEVLVSRAVPFSITATHDAILSDIIQAAFNEGERLRAKQSVPKKPVDILIPINLGNAHWSVLKVTIESDNTLSAAYFDAMGNPLPSKLAAVLKGVTGVHDLPIVAEIEAVQLQQDNYSCGDWLVWRMMSWLDERNIPNQCPAELSVILQPFGSSSLFTEDEAAMKSREIRQAILQIVGVDLAYAHSAVISTRRNVFFSGEDGAAGVINSSPTPKYRNRSGSVMSSASDSSLTKSSTPMHSFRNLSMTPTRLSPNLLRARERLLGSTDSESSFSESGLLYDEVDDELVTKQLAAYDYLYNGHFHGAPPQDSMHWNQNALEHVYNHLNEIALRLEKSGSDLKSLVEQYREQVEKNLQDRQRAFTFKEFYLKHEGIHQLDTRNHSPVYCSKQEAGSRPRADLRTAEALVFSSIIVKIRSNPSISLSMLEEAWSAQFEAYDNFLQTKIQAEEIARIKNVCSNDRARFLKSVKNISEIYKLNRDSNQDLLNKSQRIQELQELNPTNLINLMALIRSVINEQQITEFNEEIDRFIQEEKSNSRFLAILNKIVESAPSVVTDIIEAAKGWTHRGSESLMGYFALPIDAELQMINKEREEKLKQALINFIPQINQLASWFDRLAEAAEENRGKFAQQSAQLKQIASAIECKTESVDKLLFLCDQLFKFNAETTESLENLSNDVVSPMLEDFSAQTEYIRTIKLTAFAFMKLLKPVFEYVHREKINFSHSFINNLQDICFDIIGGRKEFKVLYNHLCSFLGNPEHKAWHQVTAKALVGLLHGLFPREIDITAVIRALQPCAEKGQQLKTQDIVLLREFSSNLDQLAIVPTSAIESKADSISLPDVYEQMDDAVKEFLDAAKERVEWTHEQSFANNLLNQIRDAETAHQPTVIFLRQELENLLEQQQLRRAQMEQSGESAAQLMLEEYSPNLFLKLKETAEAYQAQEQRLAKVRQVWEEISESANNSNEQVISQKIQELSGAVGDVEEKIIQAKLQFASQSLGVQGLFDWYHRCNAWIEEFARLGVQPTKENWLSAIGFDLESRVQQKEDDIRAEQTDDVQEIGLESTTRQLQLAENFKVERLSLASIQDERDRQFDLYKEKSAEHEKTLMELAQLKQKGAKTAQQEQSLQRLEIDLAKLKRRVNFLDELIVKKLNEKKETLNRIKIKKKEIQGKDTVENMRLELARLAHIPIHEETEAESERKVILQHFFELARKEEILARDIVKNTRLELARFEHIYEEITAKYNKNIGKLELERSSSQSDEKRMSQLKQLIELLFNEQEELKERIDILQQLLSDSVLSPYLSYIEERISDAADTNVFISDEDEVTLAIFFGRTQKKLKTELEKAWKNLWALFTNGREPKESTKQQKDSVERQENRKKFLEVLGKFRKAEDGVNALAQDESNIYKQTHGERSQARSPRPNEKHVRHMQELGDWRRLTKPIERRIGQIDHQNPDVDFTLKLEEFDRILEEEELLRSEQLKAKQLQDSKVQAIEEAYNREIDEEIKNSLQQLGIDWAANQPIPSITEMDVAFAKKYQALKKCMPDIAVQLSKCEKLNMLWLITRGSDVLKKSMLPIICDFLFAAKDEQFNIQVKTAIIKQYKDKLVEFQKACSVGAKQDKVAKLVEIKRQLETLSEGIIPILSAADYVFANDFSVLDRFLLDLIESIKIELDTGHDGIDYVGNQKRRQAVDQLFARAQDMLSYIAASNVDSQVCSISHLLLAMYDVQANIKKECEFSFRKAENSHLFKLLNKYIPILQQQNLIKLETLRDIEGMSSLHGNEIIANTKELSRQQEFGDEDNVLMILNSLPTMKGVSDYLTLSAKILNGWGAARSIYDQYGKLLRSYEMFSGSSFVNEETIAALIENEIYHDYDSINKQLFAVLEDKQHGLDFVISNGSLPAYLKYLYVNKEGHRFSANIKIAYDAVIAKINQCVHVQLRIILTDVPKYIEDAKKYMRQGYHVGDVHDIKFPTDNVGASLLAEIYRKVIAIILNTPTLKIDGLERGLERIKSYQNREWFVLQDVNSIKKCEKAEYDLTRVYLKLLLKESGLVKLKELLELAGEEADALVLEVGSTQFGKMEFEKLIWECLVEIDNLNEDQIKLVSYIANTAIQEIVHQKTIDWNKIDLLLDYASAEQKKLLHEVIIKKINSCSDEESFIELFNNYLSVILEKSLIDEFIKTVREMQQAQYKSLHWIRAFNDLYRKSYSAYMSVDAQYLLSEAVADQFCDIEQQTKIKDRLKAKRILKEISNLLESQEVYWLNTDTTNLALQAKIKEIQGDFTSLGECLRFAVRQAESEDREGLQASYSLRCRQVDDVYVQIIKEAVNGTIDIQIANRIEMAIPKEGSDLLINIKEHATASTDSKDVYADPRFAGLEDILSTRYPAIADQIELAKTLLQTEFLSPTAIARLFVLQPSHENRKPLLSIADLVLISCLSEKRKEALKVKVSSILQSLKAQQLYMEHPAYIVLFNLLQAVSFESQQTVRKLEEILPRLELANSQINLMSAVCLSEEVVLNEATPMQHAIKLCLSRLPLNVDITASKQLTEEMHNFCSKLIQEMQQNRKNITYELIAAIVSEYGSAEQKTYILKIRLANESLEKLSAMLKEPYSDFYSPFPDKRESAMSLLSFYADADKEHRESFIAVFENEVVQKIFVTCASKMRQGANEQDDFYFEYAFKNIKDVYDYLMNHEGLVNKDNWTSILESACSLANDRLKQDLHPESDKFKGSDQEGNENNLQTREERKKVSDQVLFNTLLLANFGQSDQMHQPSRAMRILRDYYITHYMGYGALIDENRKFRYGTVERLAKYFPDEMQNVLQLPKQRNEKSLELGAKLNLTQPIVNRIALLVMKYLQRVKQVLIADINKEFEKSPAKEDMVRALSQSQYDGMLNAIAFSNQTGCVMGEGASQLLERVSCVQSLEAMLFAANFTKRAAEFRATLIADMERVAFLEEEKGYITTLLSAHDIYPRDEEINIRTEYLIKNLFDKKYFEQAAWELNILLKANASQVRFSELFIEDIKNKIDGLFSESSVLEHLNKLQQSNFLVVLAKTNIVFKSGESAKAYVERVNNKIHSIRLISKINNLLNRCIEAVSKDDKSNAYSLLNEVVKQAQVQLAFNLEALILKEKDVEEIYKKIEELALEVAESRVINSEEQQFFSPLCQSIYQLMDCNNAKAFDSAAVPKGSVTDTDNAYKNVKNEFCYVANCYIRAHSQIPAFGKGAPRPLTSATLQSLMPEVVLSVKEAGAAAAAIETGFLQLQQTTKVFNETFANSLYLQECMLDFLTRDNRLKNIYAGLEQDIKNYLIGLEFDAEKIKKITDGSAQQCFVKSELNKAKFNNLVDSLKKQLKAFYIDHPEIISFQDVKQYLAENADEYRLRGLITTLAEVLKALMHKTVGYIRLSSLEENNAKKAEEAIFLLAQCAAMHELNSYQESENKARATIKVVDNLVGVKDLLKKHLSLIDRLKISSTKYRNIITAYQEIISNLAQPFNLEVVCQSVSETECDSIYYNADVRISKLALEKVKANREVLVSPVVAAQRGLQLYARNAYIKRSLSEFHAAAVSLKERASVVCQTRFLAPQERGEFVNGLDDITQEYQEALILNNIGDCVNAAQSLFGCLLVPGRVLSVDNLVSLTNDLFSIKNVLEVTRSKIDSFSDEWEAVLKYIENYLNKDIALYETTNARAVWAMYKTQQIEKDLQKMIQQQEVTINLPLLIDNFEASIMYLNSPSVDESLVMKWTPITQIITCIENELIKLKQKEDNAYNELSKRWNNLFSAACRKNNLIVSYLYSSSQMFRAPLFDIENLLQRANQGESEATNILIIALFRRGVDVTVKNYKSVVAEISIKASPVLVIHKLKVAYQSMTFDRGSFNRLCDEFLAIADLQPGAWAQMLRDFPIETREQIVKEACGLPALLREAESKAKGLVKTNFEDTLVMQKLALFPSKVMAFLEKLGRSDADELNEKYKITLPVSILQSKSAFMLKPVAGTQYSSGAAQQPSKAGTTEIKTSP